MAISAKDAVQKFKVELLQELPLDDPIFFAMAERAGLFPLGINKAIKGKETRAHKVDYFLDHVIEPGADDYLPKLLQVMRESKVANVMRLADDIQAAVAPERSAFVWTRRIQGMELEDFDLNLEDDVAEAYSYLLSRIALLFEQEVKFSELKTICERTGILLPTDFKEAIKQAQDHKDIFEVLENPLYCNWLNVRLLKRIARNIHNTKAVKFIQKYEKHVHSRKVSSVKKYFTLRYFNKSTLSVIKVKFNNSPEGLTVKQIIDCNEKVEDALNIFTGGASIVDAEPGCLKLTFVIPVQYTMDAYNTAMKNFLKLRKFHIQYLEIESFPKVFAFNHPDKQLAHSVLSSSPPKCMHLCSSPRELINYYYTYLESHIDADSVSHMLHYNHLITDEDYKAITSAPNDHKMNTVLLQYIRAMDTNLFIKFCNVLKNIETQKIIGFYLSNYTLKGSLKDLSYDDEEDQPMVSSLLYVFLDLVDELVVQMATADVAAIAKKCGTLMASAVHHIPLFTPEFLSKLINCTFPFILKMYLFPYINWFDCSLLKQLVIFSDSKEAILMVDEFVHSLDYSKPVTSYHIPEVSQLLIPLDSSDYTLLATMHAKCIDELTLQDVLGIKKTLISTLEISDYAAQLSAVHIKSSCFYWLIPIKLRPLIEGKLIKNQLKLCNEGIIFIKLISINFISEELTLHQNDLNFISINLHDSQEVILMKQQISANHQELLSMMEQNKRLETKSEAQRSSYRLLNAQIKEVKQKLYESERKKEELIRRTYQENQKHQTHLKMKNNEISELTKELNSVKESNEALERKDLTSPPSVTPKPVPSVMTKSADYPPPALPPNEPTTKRLGGNEPKAYLSKIFQGCPLHLNCAMVWMHPTTKVSYAFLGAEEGLYSLELSQNTDIMKQVYPRACHWIYIFSNSLVSIMGRNRRLSMTDLKLLHDKDKQLRGLRTRDHTSKFGDSKGCMKCCVARNPCTGEQYLIAAIPKGIMLLQWFQPRHIFMLVKVLETKLPEPLLTFKAIVQEGNDYPSVCVGVRQGENGGVKFEMINLNFRAIWFESEQLGEPLNVVSLDQIEKDTLMVGYDQYCKFVDRNGVLKPSVRLPSQLVFDYKIDALVKIQDCVLNFHKHGFQGKSLLTQQVIAEITDKTKLFHLLGSVGNVLIETHELDNPTGPANLYNLMQDKNN